MPNTALLDAAKDRGVRGVRSRTETNVVLRGAGSGRLAAATGRRRDRPRSGWRGKQHLLASSLSIQLAWTRPPRRTGVIERTRQVQ